MVNATLDRSLIQVAVLFAAYYAVPPLVAEFIGPPVDALSEYAPIAIATLIAAFIIYKLFELRRAFAGGVQVAVEKLSGRKPVGSTVGQASDKLVLLTYVILMAVIVLPIVDGFVGHMVLTILKLVIVAYCLFLAYQLWNAFGVADSSARK